MKKSFNNIIFGSFVLMAGATVFTLVRKNNVRKQMEEEKEELKREYIDLSNQLKKALEEQEFLDKELDELKEEKVYQKDYTA